MIAESEYKISKRAKKNTEEFTEFYGGVDMAYKTKDRLIDEIIVSVSYMENLCKKLFSLFKLGNK